MFIFIDQFSIQSIKSNKKWFFLDDSFKRISYYIDLIIILSDISFYRQNFTNNSIRKIRFKWLIIHSYSYYRRRINSYFCISIGSFYYDFLLIDFNICYITNVSYRALLTITNIYTV